MFPFQRAKWSAPKAIAGRGKEVILSKKTDNKAICAQFWQVAVKELAMTDNPLVDIKTVRLFILSKKLHI